MMTIVSTKQGKKEWKGEEKIKKNQRENVALLPPCLNYMVPK